MRLTIKLVLWFFGCVVLAVGINGLYGVRGELARYESDLAARHVQMGHILSAAFVEVMDTDGEARAVSVLEYTDRSMRLVNIRWVYLEADAPAERRPMVPLPKLESLASNQHVHDKAAGWLRTYVPVHIEGRAISALEFSEALDGEREVVRHAVLRELRSVGIVALVIGFAATVLGAFFVARPMRRLVAHARRIGRGDLSPMPAEGRDEIGELGREMNAMCTQLSEAERAKLKALEQLRHSERLNTVGKLASGLAHELGTPLNVITLRARAVADGRAQGDRAREAGKSIAEQATRVTNLVRRLLDFARRTSPQRDLVDLEQLACRTADLLEPVATKAKVRFGIQMAHEAVRVRGDAGQLEQVLTNLMMNAIQAMPRGGTIDVTSATKITIPPADHGGPSAPYVQLAVRDEGEGIADDVMPHLFEPFFTTKDVGEGTGLGLAVCYGIVRDHGGWIDVTGERGKGATFTVYLPLEPAS